MVFGHRLHWMISEMFSNRYDPVILWMSYKPTSLEGPEPAARPLSLRALSWPSGHSTSHRRTTPTLRTRSGAPNNLLCPGSSCSPRSGLPPSPTTRDAPLPARPAAVVAPRPREAPQEPAAPRTPPAAPPPRSSGRGPRAPTCASSQRSSHGSSPGPGGGGGSRQRRGAARRSGGCRCRREGHGQRAGKGSDSAPGGPHSSRRRTTN